MSMYQLGSRGDISWSPPLIFDLNISSDEEKLQELLNNSEVIAVKDEFKVISEELYKIENPLEIDDVSEDKLDSYRKSIAPNGSDKYGSWVYYPWSKILVHFPTKSHLHKLLSARNRDLITSEESRDLRDNKTIVVVGLSVGSNVVESLLTQSIGSKYVLVDMDELSPTNLNRIHSSFSNVGVHKVDMMAKRISELNPYIDQKHFKEGLNKENLKAITDENPDVIIDEMDSLPMKLALREHARNLKVPVLMATDNGDGIILDVEIYKTGKEKILHGIIPEEVIDKILNSSDLPRSELGKLIGRYFVDLNNVPLRMLESLNRVGKTLPSWPQLGTAATLSGLYVAYAARKILLKQKINTGRVFASLEDQLDPNVGTEPYELKRKQEIEKLTRGEK